MGVKSIAERTERSQYTCVTHGAAHAMSAFMQHCAAWITVQGMQSTS